MYIYIYVYDPGPRFASPPQWYGPPSGKVPCGMVPAYMFPLHADHFIAIFD